MQDNPTHGVKTLLGDPKKAILKLSGPMIIGMLVQSIYNIADGIWVAGLGSNALAAIGLFYPVFMVIISLAAGIGVGGSSAISRKIGAKDKEKADSAAVHTFVIGIIIGIIFTVLTLPFLKQIFLSTGSGGNVVKLVVSYARALVGGTVIIVFTNIATGVLRGEGDTKRAMYAMILGSGLNIVLDPIFIYTFKMGIAGAAWATLLSICITAMLLLYWLFMKKDTYVNISFTHFKFNYVITKEILRVGIPSSFAQLSMSIAMFILNYIIIKASGTDGIAVFTSAWRIIMFGTIPLIGIAMGVTAVTGAAYGARDINKLDTAYLYSIKLGITMEIFASVLILAFAGPLSFLFTYSKSAAHISGSLITAFRILELFLPTVPLGMLTSSMFQGIGRGENSLIVTILRTLIMQVFFAYLLGITLKTGLTGIWWGIVSGNIIAAIFAFMWGRLTVKRLKQLYVKTVS
jgi:putative MATE family efflux protein